jgi:hypothetical protein
MRELFSAYPEHDVYGPVVHCHGRDTRAQELEQLLSCNVDKGAEFLCELLSIANPSRQNPWKKARSIKYLIRPLPGLQGLVTRDRRWRGGWWPEFRGCGMAATRNWPAGGHGVQLTEVGRNHKAADYQKVPIG